MGGEIVGDGLIASVVVSVAVGTRMSVAGGWLVVTIGWKGVSVLGWDEIVGSLCVQPATRRNTAITKIIRLRISNMSLYLSVLTPVYLDMSGVISRES